MPLPTTPLHCGNQVLDLSQPQIMGILNVTPDSFSDGGKYTHIDAALYQCEAMITAGASIIDIGGESTRPDAATVSEQAEADRVLPAVAAITQRFDVVLSIDTSTPTVMQQAAQLGAHIWNDVRALARPNALAMAAQLDIPVMLMHMRGEPATMQNFTQYNDVTTTVISELSGVIDNALQAGVKKHNLLVDPGFGFAKQFAHNMQLLNNLYRLHELKLPIVVGISRKRSLAEVLQQAGQATDIANRIPLGMAVALLSVQQGASIIRTHDVAITQAGLTLWQQMQSA